MQLCTIPKKPFCSQGGPPRKCLNLGALSLASEAPWQYYDLLTGLGGERSGNPTERLCAQVIRSLVPRPQASFSLLQCPVQLFIACSTAASEVRPGNEATQVIDWTLNCRCPDIVVCHLFTGINSCYANQLAILTKTAGVPALQ